MDRFYYAIDAETERVLQEVGFALDKPPAEVLAGAVRMLGMVTGLRSPLMVQGFHVGGETRLDG